MDESRSVVQTSLSWITVAVGAQAVALVRPLCRLKSSVAKSGTMK